MDQESKSGYLVDTTDCLEAISVIRCWKNFLFIIIIVCLLLLQGLFWVVNVNDVESDQPWAAAAAKAQQSPQAGEPAVVKIPEKIKQAAKQAAQEANAPAQLEQQPEEGVIEKPPGGIRFSIAPKMEHVVALVRFLNFILIPASVIYCLTMLFAFKVSLIGRLGGINHIARAFFLALLFAVLFLPWQLMFTPVFAGAMWTPTELITACQMQKTTLAQISFYLRFSGYWLLVLLLVVFSQIRSMRWAKATLRRLEVV